MSKVSYSEMLTTAREVERELTRLDESIASHVDRSQFAKVYSAAVAVVAVPALFIAPPVGVGLGVASAGVGIGATIGDQVHHHFYAKGPFKDTMDKFERLGESFEAEIRDFFESHKDRIMATGGAGLSGLTVYGGGDFVMKLLAAEPDEVVRMGCLASRPWGGGGIQVMKASQAGKVGGGTAVAGGGAAVSKLSVGLSVVGAYFSIKEAENSLKTPESNSPLIDEVRKAKESATAFVRALERL